MNLARLLFMVFFVLCLTQPVQAQWLSQYKEDPFGEDHIVGAFTAKLGKGLIVRCVGAKRLELMFLPNEVGSNDIISVANLAGTTIKLRIDKDKIDIIKSVVQLHDGKVIALADLDILIAKRMANARKRIAAVLALMGDQFGSTSFGARGSTKAINKVVRACANVYDKKRSQNSSSIVTVNKLRKSRLTNPADGEKILLAVQKQLTEMPFNKSIQSITLEGLVRPYKLSIDFLLSERISKESIQKISRLVREQAGGGYKRYFIGFYLKGDTGGTYWATAHHDPDLKVKFLGLSSRAHINFVEEAKKYRPKKGETLLASAVLNHGLSFHVVIFKRGQELFSKQFYQDGSGSEDKLLEKDGSFWKADNSFKESYRINDGMLELHDQDGVITRSRIF